MSVKNKEGLYCGKSFLEKVGDTFRSVKTKEKSKWNSIIDTKTSGNFAGFSAADIKTKECDYRSLSQPNIADPNCLSENEVDAAFEKFLDDLNLKDKQKEDLRGSSIENKKLLLSQRLRNETTARGGKVKYDSPADYIRLLNSALDNMEKIENVLISLRVSLANNPVSWIQNFGQPGLNLLIGMLQLLNDEILENSDDLVLKHAQHECVKCFRAFMNNKYGLLEVFDSDQALVALVRSCSFNNIPSMIDAVKLLAAVSLFDVENKCGHSKVLEAMTVVGESEHRFRFTAIVAGVCDCDNSILQDACMQLINAIITQPDDLDFRLHLRNEIIRTGLTIDLIELYKSANYEDFQRQVEIFIEHKENDAEEFSSRLDTVRSEFDTLSDCSNLLFQKAKDTQVEPYLLSILQHLLLIRDEYSVKTAYYKLLEEIVSQVVLFKHGCDPDFRAHRRFQIDVEDTVEKILEKNADFILPTSISTDEIKKKLDVAITAKQEADAKMLQYQAKVKEYDNEVTLLRNHIIEAGLQIDIPRTGCLIVGASPSIPVAPPVPSTFASIPRPPPLPGIPAAPPPPPGVLLNGSVMCRPPAPPPVNGLLTGLVNGPPPPPVPGALFGPPRAPVMPEIPKFLMLKNSYGIKSGIKLKRLNWKAISPEALNEDSFWAKAREDEIVDDQLLADLKLSFAVSSAKSPASALDSCSDHVDSSTTGTDDSISLNSDVGQLQSIGKRHRKKKDLKVLDSKTAQSLAILQRSLKMSHEEFCNAVLEIDESKLYEPTLQQLIYGLPANDQLKQLQTFSSKLDELTEAECFLIKLGSIERLKPRLQSICFKLKFPEIIADIKPEIAAASEACEEVSNSNGFARVLEVILLLGNCMNNTTVGVGTRNSLTYAFDISVLTKLVDTKTQTNDSTLLHFVTKIVDQRWRQISKFPADFVHVATAARFSPELVQKQLNFIKQSLKKLETELQDYKLQSNRDNFIRVMSNFLNDANDQYSLINSMYECLTDRYAKLAKYFSFDPKKYPIDAFFGDLKTFKDQYEKAVADNDKLKEMGEKVKRAQDSRKKAEDEKMRRQVQRKNIIDISNNSQEGVMDNLMEALRSGQAFPQRVRTPAKRTFGTERREAFNRRRSRGAE